MHSDFVLSQADGRPMYLQIIEQIKKKISIGDWQPGYKLTSIREFAVELRVSVITVKRAYFELENEGVIVTQQGKGSFVSSNVNLDEQLREQEMNGHFVDAIKLAESLGLSINQQKERLEELNIQLAKSSEE